jgi:hypothetical protein
MAHSGDNLEEDFTAPNTVECPICGSTEGCVHLLLHIDVTFSEMHGGTFFDLEPKAVEVLDNAIMKLLKAQKKMKQLPASVPRRLADLVEEVREQIGDSLEEENLRSCYSSFLRYLSDLLDALPGVIETSYDFDNGFPGFASLYQSYWVKHAKRVAKAALQQIEREAKSLQQLP